LTSLCVVPHRGSPVVVCFVSGFDKIQIERAKLAWDVFLWFGKEPPFPANHRVFHTDVVFHRRCVTVRSYRSIEELESVIGDLEAVTQDVVQSVKMLKTHGMAELNCHGENIFARRIPELVAWSTKIKMEAMEQTRSHARNRRAKADLKVERKKLERKGVKSAKKAVKKRALRTPKKGRKAGRA